MVITRYSNQQVCIQIATKSLSCHPRTSKIYQRQDDVFLGTNQFLLSGSVLFQNLTYKVIHWLSSCPSPKIVTQKVFLAHESEGYTKSSYYTTLKAMHVRRAVWGMLYADDAGIVSRSPAGLARMMTVIVEVFGAFGLTVSEKKTETLLMRTP